MSNLSVQQLTSLQNALRNYQIRLQSQVRSAIEERENESYTALVTTGQDIADISVAKHFLDLETSMVELKVGELQAIKAAQARITDGDYGECMDCGDDIDYQRLSAYPVAKRCIHCQSAHERLYSAKRYASL